MAAQEEKSTTRVDLKKLWQCTDSDEENIEDRYRREKDEMLAIIIKKTREIKVLKKIEEEYKREVTKSNQLANALKRAEKDLKERDATIKQFQKNHSNLLWEVSKERNERWLIKNQINKKKDSGSETWHQARNE